MTAPDRLDRPTSYHADPTCPHAVDPAQVDAGRAWLTASVDHAIRLIAQLPLLPAPTEARRGLTVRAAAVRCPAPTARTARGTHLHPDPAFRAALDTYRGPGDEQLLPTVLPLTDPRVGDVTYLRLDANLPLDRIGYEERTAGGRTRTLVSVHVPPLRTWLELGPVPAEQARAVLDTYAVLLTETAVRDPRATLLTALLINDVSQQRP